MSAPSLYTFIDKDRLHEMLDAFHSCLDIPVQVIDTNGEIPGVLRGNHSLLPDI